MRLRSIAYVITLMVGGCATDAVESDELNPDLADSADGSDIESQSQALCSNSRPENSGTRLVSAGHYGSWGCMDFCPEGSFVQQILTRWDCQGGGADCSGVNNIVLSCHDLNGTWVEQNITSSQGWWGAWYGWYAPPDWGFATGMFTFTMPKQGGGDDQSLTRVNLVNSSGQWGDPEGHYSIDAFAQVDCPAGEAICGIQTRLEGKQGTSQDDTALNGVKIACCPL